MIQDDVEKLETLKEEGNGEATEADGPAEFARAIASKAILHSSVILSDRRERRISTSDYNGEILRRFAPQNDGLRADLD